MEYKGKLYGSLGGKHYFDTGKTADDWDNLEMRLLELENENKSLKDAYDCGYKKGYNDATREACDEIANNYHPNE